MSSQNRESKIQMEKLDTTYQHRRQAQDHKCKRRLRRVSSAEPSIQWGAGAGCSWLYFEILEHPHLFVFLVLVCKHSEPASCCPRNKNSGQCSTLCLCRSLQTHEESEKSTFSPKIAGRVFLTLEGSGK